MRKGDGVANDAGILALFVSHRDLCGVGIGNRRGWGGVHPRRRCPTGWEAPVETGIRNGAAAIRAAGSMIQTMGATPSCRRTMRHLSQLSILPTGPRHSVRPAAIELR